ncbi:hypothetical protein [Hirschia litorea]|uniref:Uncharacterized protein n=1 Tax=Hirschia litorea TaxID=1199156 RepID=A0ABW2IH09_9PROT
MDTAKTRTKDGIGDATLQPLSDLNIRREQIPDALKNMRTPYGAVPIGCDPIANEVNALTEILGPDSDAPSQNEEDPTLSEEAGEEIGEEVADYALDTVRGLTSDAIPFRSVVRRATGAKKHDKRVRQAYEKGLQRRSYLKGIGMERGCIPPASPEIQIFEEAEEVEIEYRKTTPN